jgi:hypothetical protein
MGRDVNMEYDNFIANPGERIRVLLVIKMMHVPSRTRLCSSVRPSLQQRRDVERKYPRRQKSVLLILVENTSWLVHETCQGDHKTDTRKRWGTLTYKTCVIIVTLQCSTLFREGNVTSHIYSIRAHITLVLSWYWKTKYRTKRPKHKFIIIISGNN